MGSGSTLRVLVTGAARELGSEVVRRLDHSPRVDTVIALDLERPRGRFAKVDFVRADIRTVRTAAKIREARPDVVVHCALRLTGNAREAHEHNVIGTVNVLAGSTGARRLVVRSSVMVYPSGIDMPSVLIESDADRRPPAGPIARGISERESLVADHAVANQETVVTVLRLAHTAGRRWQAPLTEYLAHRSPPVIAGFDPRLQLLAEADAAEAVVRAATTDHPGVFNVAPEGAVLLSRLLHAAGRRPVPILPLGGAWVQRQSARLFAGLELDQELAALLAWGAVMDIDSLLDEFGWIPPVTTREALTEFLDSRSTTVLTA